VKLMDNNHSELEEKNKQLEGRVLELENNWKRAVADYRNLKRRTAEEQTAFAAFANQVLLTELLPVLDALEAAESHLKDEGLELAVRKFMEVLKEFNVTEFESLGKDFDAGKMEAIEVVLGEKNKVLEVVSTGYMLRDRVLRVARVKVGSGETIDQPA
jgi:molecular chaperone GrpE